MYQEDIFPRCPEVSRFCHPEMSLHHCHPEMSLLRVLNRGNTFPSKLLFSLPSPWNVFIQGLVVNSFIRVHSKSIKIRDSGSSPEWRKERLWNKCSPLARKGVQSGKRWDSGSSPEWQKRDPEIKLGVMHPRERSAGQGSERQRARFRI